MQTAINLMAGIRNTWFQMRALFLGPSKSILFLPLACTDLYLVGGEEEQKQQAGDLIMGLVNLTNAKQVTGKRDKKEKI